MNKWYTIWILIGAITLCFCCVQMRGCENDRNNAIEKLRQWHVDNGYVKQETWYGYKWVLPQEQENEHD